MKFWDSSAMVPLLVQEPMTPSLLRLLREDSVMHVWWGSEVECVSALARLEREAALASESMTQAMMRLRALRASWQEIQPAEMLKEIAFRLLRVHKLRAADSLQLAAALVACESRPSSLEFVCLDERLSLAAQREGFNVVNLSE
ncbi:MAG: type II toxin-antitoxin system VapC family toxin [Gammaproteobacteria bacterium]